jgi:glycyl-tRNA synthetase beta chain
MPDFLLEIGLEEIPARMIDGAEEELQRRLAELLTRESLSDSPQIERYSTPRRLAVVARDVWEAQADSQEVLKGPSVQVAFKDGNPQMPAIKFAEKAGVDVAKLERIKDAKGEYISAKVTKKGRTAQQILSEMLPKEINALYWAKNMYWREGKPERFVRPVRWMVAMLGGKVVPLEYGGIRAGKTSRGHRVVGEPPTRGQNQAERWGNHQEVLIQEPASYAANLKDAAVFVRREERFALIRSQLDRATRQIPGARWREDSALLNTVVNLTEFPSVILSNFDPEFLSLPEEVLVTVMRDHQKYFAVEDASGKLAPHFLAVLNTDSDPTGVIRHGHERVLRARFNDARFFWDTDQKHPLRERVEWLKNVTFQKDLGSYYEKTLRVQKLASQICALLNDGEKKIVREGIVHKAALLAKTDLTTELVKEFTELQGIVGGLYAKAQGLDPAIGDAIYDQYKPESMEDAVPRTIEGAVLSIADKADSIAGMFALGMIPSGSKDPFALRRQANGIVKTVAERANGLRLSDLFADSAGSYISTEAEKSFKVLPTVGSKYLRSLLKRRPLATFLSTFATSEELAGNLAIFLQERVEFYLRDVKGFAYDAVNAVLAVDADDVVDAVVRAEAVTKVRGLPDFESIAAAFKRINNIIRQAKEKSVSPTREFDYSVATDEAEKLLDAHAKRLAPRFEKARSSKDYVDALIRLSTLREHVDTFFDKVMVMVEDENIRSNRLALLQSLLNEFSTIADFSEIVTEKK